MRGFQTFGGRMNICDHLCLVAGSTRELDVGLNTSLLINSQYTIMTNNKSKNKKSFKEAYI